MKVRGGGPPPRSLITVGTLVMLVAACRSPPDGPAPFAPQQQTRPAFRLPAGVHLGDSEGEYVGAVDSSILVFVPLPDRPYFIGKCEVTWQQYRAFCASTGRRIPSNVIHDRELYEASLRDPVFNVSWDDARAYVEWAGLRLPTEAEWVYAATAGGDVQYPWGNRPPTPGFVNLADALSLYCDGDVQFSDGFAYVSPVGSFPQGASPIGCLDMAGNVSEWIEDEVDGRRVLKGGSWCTGLRACHVRARAVNEHRARHGSFGIRVCVSARR